ncbi:MAG: ester cyclase [Thermoanaerobaculia bacterium]
MHDEATLRRNKAAVTRFNREVIERGNLASFNELLAPDFVNRTALPGISPGREGMHRVLFGILRTAFPDLTVELHDQIAEDDKVTTRKTIRGTHSGLLPDLLPTGRAVEIAVIDIVRLRDGQYVEHWGINTLPIVFAQLRQEAGTR